LLLAAWIAVPYALFSLAATRMESYVLIAAPAVFIALAEATARLWDARPRLAPPWRAAALGSCVAFFALPVRNVVEHWKPFSTAPIERAAAEALRRLPHDPGKERLALFGVQRPIEAMFYSDAVAHAEPLEEAARRRCQQQGLRPLTLPARLQ